MMTVEETRVLGFLRRRPAAALADLLAGCLPGASPQLAIRMVSHLEWLGYVVVYYGAGGEPALVQITDKGQEVSDE